MKIGKLTNEQLRQLVLDKLHISRREVKVGAGVGIDCAVLDLEGDYCVLSTDPITAAEQGAGALAVHISANDIAASGGEPVAILVTILLPSTETMEGLSARMEEIYREAKGLHIDVVGGHTEVTDAVNRTVISVAAIGRTDRVMSCRDIRPGDWLVQTKSAGLEGTVILFRDHPADWEGLLSETELAELRQMQDSLSIVSEARIGKEVGAVVMHDVTEGGVLGAAYELAEAAGRGLRVDAGEIPVSPITRKIAGRYGIDPYRLISSGSLLIAISADRGPAMLAAFSAAGIPARRIGEFTTGTRIWEAEAGDLLPLSQDELFLAK